MTNFLATTPVSGAVCRRCRTLTLTGHAEGLRATVDLTPLSPAGELSALLAGRWTYTLMRTGLVHRDAGRIAGNGLPADAPILAEHRCGYTPPPEHQAPGPPIRYEPAPENPPY